MSAASIRKIFYLENEVTRSMRDRAYDALREEVEQRRSERAERHRQNRSFLLAGSLLLALAGYVLFG